MSGARAFGSAFAAVFRDTLRAVFADPAARSTMIGAVVLYSFYYPAPYRREVASRLPVVAVDLDRSAMSRGLVRRLLAVRAVRLAETVSSVRAAQARVTDGDADAAVVILPDFQRDILRGRQGRVALFGTGASLGRGGPALTGLGDAVGAFARDDAVRAQARLAGAPAPPPVQLVQRPLFNTREGYGSAVVPGVALLIVHQTLLIGVGLLAGARRERREALATPGPGLLGEAAAFGVIGMASLLYYTGFVFWLQDYPRAASPGALLVGGVAFVAATVSFALFVGSFFATRERALPLLAFTSITLFFLSNATWPAPASPAALTWLAKLLPTTAGITGLGRILQAGARLGEVAPELANLAALTLLYGSLTVWRHRRLALSS
jgi:ABC-2 type transport system permease protein